MYYRSGKIMIGLTQITAYYSMTYCMMLEVGAFVWVRFPVSTIPFMPCVMTRYVIGTSLRKKFRNSAIANYVVQIVF